jgi:hypothetical protein
MHFFHLEPTSARTREQRWALVSVMNLESYLGRRSSPPLSERIRRVRVLVVHWLLAQAA